MRNTHIRIKHDELIGSLCGASINEEPSISLEHVHESFTNEVICGHITKLPEPLCTNCSTIYMDKFVTQAQFRRG